MPTKLTLGEFLSKRTGLKRPCVSSAPRTSLTPVISASWKGVLWRRRREATNLRSMPVTCT